MATNQKRTNTIVDHESRKETHTTRANQAHIGKNHRMFSEAVTLPVQRLRKYACESTVAAMGLTMIRRKFVKHHELFFV
jgi:hypothetical protein